MNRATRAWYRDTGIGIMLIALFLFMTAASRPTHAGEGTVPDSPYELVTRVTESMLAALREKRELVKDNPYYVYTLANEIILPHFDFNYMSMLALGKYWRSANNDQKLRFPLEFRLLLVRTYATALNQYTNEKVIYLPFHDDPATGDVRVDTEIRRVDGPPIPVSYNLHKTDGNWKVYDITIDGISLVTNYRSTFSTMIRKDGLDELIRKLAERNEHAVTINNH